MYHLFRERGKNEAILEVEAIRSAEVIKHGQGRQTQWIRLGEQRIRFKVITKRRAIMAQSSHSSEVICDSSALICEAP